jgi:hypothetical protein
MAKRLHDSDFVKRAEWLAMLTERLAVPYLLGLTEDFDAVREMVRERTANEVEEIKKYRLPKNIREEWL